MCRCVIVTGANGLVGSALIKKLLQNGVKVIGISRSFRNSVLPNQDNLIKLEIDASNEQEMLEKLPKFKYYAFYHLAWNGVNSKYRATPNIQLANLKLAISCCNVAKKLQCRRFLCAGTIAERVVDSLHNLATTSASMFYGVSKYCCHLLVETYCKSINLDLVWMEIASVYGQNNNTGNVINYTINQLLNDKEACFGPGQQFFDFIYVDDLVEAMYRLGFYEISSQYYFLGTNQPNKLFFFIKAIAKIMGKEDLVKFGIREDDGIKFTKDMFDSSKLMADIGKYITVSFEEGISRTLQLILKEMKPIL